jgi:Kef-type K+ transport system membrane component KefB
VSRVFLYSGLLVAGLVVSQLLPALGTAEGATREALRVLTVAALGFVMIRVGLEFELDRSRKRELAIDYGVAATAAAFPWIFAAAYFVLVMGPPGGAGAFETWKEALLAGRFAAPTSAGVLFSMLAAAGLGATWLFRKARVLAIFDDLDTVLFMIPLKMMMVGIRWQLAAVVLVIAALLWAAWRFQRRLRAPSTWPWLLGYAVALAGAAEGIHLASLQLDDSVGIHIEVLLPAFVLGVVLAHAPGAHAHPAPSEERAATAVSAVFMVLVGASMPKVDLGEASAWALAGHTLAITALANLGKMFPLFVYRTEATLRQRLALSIGMWPRGEVGAGVLVVSLSYGIAGPMISVAALSLALNLLLTGAFIAIVKRLLAEPGAAAAGGRAAAA